MMKRNAISAAVAMALGAVSMGANAGTLLPSAAVGNVVLATQMFGTGSEASLFTVTPVTATLQVAGVNTPDTPSVAANQTTIKFTLGGGAVFGETIATPAAMTPFLGATVVGALVAAPAVPAAGDIQFDVISGGAIGDNTVTIQFVAGAAGDTIQDIVFGGFKVKNLTDQLASAGRVVSMGMEYRNDDPAAVVAIDTSTPANIFGSASAVSFTVTPANLPRINVADSEELFTNSIPGDNDFTTPGNDRARLGTVKLNLVGGVNKEAGVPFDFQGGDAHVLTLRATGTEPLKAFQGLGGSVFLSDTGVCAGAASAQLTGTTGTVNAAFDTVTFNLSGSSANLTDTYHVCLNADNQDVIAETTISAAWDIAYFNTRYVPDALGPNNFNPLQRNGCKVTLFNVPGIDNSADDGFIRLTNTSSSVTGAVRATIWDQAGTAVVTNKDVIPAVAPHATAVLTPEAGIANTTQLTDATGTGRYRVVLTGAFPSCEALGLVRNQSTGMLVNMTATTNANFDSRTDTTGGNGTVNLATGAITGGAVNSTVTQVGNSGN